MDRPLTLGDFWAKLKQDDDGHVLAWHPLAAHSAEVAAVTEALLTRTILRDRLARLIGWKELSPVHVQRLAALAAIHDAGKVNHGFQNRGFDGMQPRGGHVGPMVEVIESEQSGTLLGALGVAPMVTWFFSERDLAHFLLATFGHHGRPVPPTHNFNGQLWQENDHRDPLGEMKTLAARTRRWFPKAFKRNDQPFPAAPPLQHAFNGVLTLADWIGSDRRFFDFAADAEDPMPRARHRAADAVEALFLDPSTPREELGDAAVGFKGVLETPDWTPYAIQQACLDLPLHGEGSLTVLESDTGSGKTEAALARFIRLYQAGLVDGLYFAVPTRAAATQLHERVREAVRRVFPKNQRPPVVQAVAGYIKADDDEATRLPDFEVRWDEDDAMRRRGWAAEHPKRYLAGPIVVGTVDQALLSVLQVNHAHMRAAALLRHFLVVDEVHASDVYMTALTDRVLDQHLAAGGHALLMSATLGAAARVHLTTAGRQAPPAPEEAEKEDYPLLTHVSAARDEPRHVHAASSGRQKTVETELKSVAGDPQAVARLAAEKAHEGARVLVIRNLVADCRATQRALEEEAGGDLLFGVRGKAAPHHSRFAPGDRRLLDDAVERAFGKDADRTGGGLVAVATQTVEQSLDIDADLLITDLCPMDVLLQRIGRLHRHDRTRPGGFDMARCIVLTPEARDPTDAITPEGHGGHGPHGLGTVYRDLRTLEATWQVLEDDCLSTWQIPKHNRTLVERATHPARLTAIADEKGDAWQRHQRQIFGQNLADRQLPSIVGLDRSAPFGNDGFAEDLDRVKTRLGRDDYRVELPEPVPGPFGQRVGEVSVSEWQVGAVPEEMVAEAVEPEEGEFSFSFAGRRFRYDRMGLHTLNDRENVSPSG